MASTKSLPRTTSMKPTFACVRCSERKVRCDKQDPCDTCVKHDVQCIFRPPKPSRRRREYVKDAMIDERLKRYEALLRDNGIDPSPVVDPSEPESRHQISSIEMPETTWTLPPQATIFKPQLVQGQRGIELVDNLWSRVAEEIHNVETTLGEDSANDTSDDEASINDFTHVLGWKSTIAIPSQPPAKLIRQLWHVFVENVNPLTKLVHVPSLQPAIERAISNIEQIPKGFEALMYAIYSLAVLSLTEDECQDMLRSTRATLLPYYIGATKAALSRAKFMSSTNIVTLQALMLHIVAIRDSYEPRAVWSLSGVAIRIAEGMGMHLDGTLLGLSSFETEIRRRIWWQLRMHDIRAGELCGQPKFRDFHLDETTPQKPANVNDADLYPSMPQAATESTRTTEMTWCLFWMELASFGMAQKTRIHKLGKPVYVSDEYAAMADARIKEVFVNELQDLIETKYLRFCDPSQPLEFMVLLGARSATNIVQFVAHHPRRWAKLDQVPETEQNFVWKTAIQLLEQYNMMQSSPQLQQFAWTVHWFIQWPAVIHVLDTLRATPSHADALRAWRLIDALYRNNSEMMLGVKKPIFIAIGSLCLNAYKARVTVSTREKKSIPDPPEYIAKLLKQRETAKLSRAAASISEKGKEMFNSEQDLITLDKDVTRPEKALQSAESLANNMPEQQSGSKRPSNPIQRDALAGDDAFWLNESLQGSVLPDSAAEMMNMDTEDFLAQDYLFDTPDGEVIDWVQWDSWLGNIDPACSNIRPGLS